MEHNNRTDNFWKAFSVILLLVVVWLAAAMYFQIGKPTYAYHESTPCAQRTLAALGTGMNLEHSSIYWVADLADKALPFVVNIQTSAKPSDEKNSQDASADDQQQQLMQQMQQMIP